MNCPKCKTELHHDINVYCHECGAYLRNECTNEDCDYQNLACYTEEKSALNFEDKYCNLCGSETSFNLDGYFDNYI